MAGASLNDIKARMKSVQNTMQITKAMELVATSKLRHAKMRAENSRAFHSALGEAIADIANSPAAKESCWFKADEKAKTLYIVVAGDRGLAGGFNSNIFKLASSLSHGEDALFLAVGKKTFDHLRYRNASLYLDRPLFSSAIGVGEAMNLADRIANDYQSGKIGKVVLIYTKFVSMMTQTPHHEVLLPLSLASEDDNDILFEGNAEEMMAKIVPDYLGGAIHASVSESLASESAARRTAMNSANKNAEEMIGDLGLKFNRARQAVITQEITEIVSGAEAL